MTNSAFETNKQCRCEVEPSIGSGARHGAVLHGILRKRKGTVVVCFSETEYDRMLVLYAGTQAHWLKKKSRKTYIALKTGVIYV